MTEPVHEVCIESGDNGSQYWRDLWRYRELLYFLAWRDVKVRYKQAVIGAAWALLRPLLIMLVLTIVFQRVAGLGADEADPYPLLVLAGLLPWQFFAGALAESGNSLLGNVQLISKVYFPRLLVPLSSVGVGLVDFLITLSLLFLLMAWYGHWPSWQIILLPVFLTLGLTIALGSGILLAALNVRYRDVRFVIPFVVQFGLYLSPVGFRTTSVPMDWRWLYELNPMVGVIEGFRWSLLANNESPSVVALGSSIVGGFALLLIGIRYFRQTESNFADVI